VPGALLSVVLVCGPVPAAELLPVDLELVLAVDVSGSIDGEEMQLQRDGYVAAISSPEVVRAVTRGVLGRIALAYVEWSGYEDRRLVVDWALVKDQATASGFAQRLAAAPVRGGVATSISGAIDFALPMFGRNGYEGTRRVIDVSGDGPNNAGPLVTDARQRAIDAGVVINGLPILNDRPNRLNFPNLEDLDRYYEGCVIAGDGAFVIVAGNFQAFGEAIRRKLILEIADRRPTKGPHRAARNSNRLHWPAATTAVYEKGCDIGERQLREFYLRRGWAN
jgi:hypothetical protein